MSRVDNFKPNKWIAGLLGFLISPVALLYIGKWKIAATYIVVFIGLGIASLKYGFLLNYIGIITLISHTLIALTSFVIAKNMKPSKRPWYSSKSGLLVLVTLLISAITFFRTFLYEPFRIPTANMVPSLSVGEHIVVSKNGYGNYKAYGITFKKTEVTASINRGDIFVFEYPPEPKISYVKRIIGLPGDQISYRSKQLFINGKLIQTKSTGTYSIKGKRFGEITFDKYQESINGKTWEVITHPEIQSDDFNIKVPMGMYFALGDNRDNSSDSRHWGFIPEKNIIGKVAYSTNQ